MSKLQPFTKDDCGKEMTMAESRQVQIRMLDAVAAFCDAHGLRYYLSGGTLLGAIRHHGFIPWDDDIDINMPRPDLEEFYRLTKGNLNGYKLAKPDMNGFAWCCESYRLYDLNTVIESFVGGTDMKHPRYCPVFIDIFPIEGLPEDEKTTKRHYQKIEIFRHLQRVASLKNMAGSNLKAHIFHIVAMIPAKLVGYKRWAIAVQKVATTYHFDDQKYVGVMTAPFQTLSEKVLKEDYLPYVDVTFEGKTYHGPANYDTYLSQLYGDYMKLPPKEKQVSHHFFNLYWRKK